MARESKKEYWVLQDIELRIILWFVERSKTLKSVYPIHPRKSKFLNLFLWIKPMAHRIVHGLNICP